jgi:hypothetical protein
VVFGLGHFWKRSSFLTLAGATMPGMGTGRRAPGAT